MISLLVPLCSFLLFVLWLPLLLIFLLTLVSAPLPQAPAPLPPPGFSSLFPPPPPLSSRLPGFLLRGCVRWLLLCYPLGFRCLHISRLVCLLLLPYLCFSSFTLPLSASVPPAGSLGFVAAAADPVAAPAVPVAAPAVPVAAQAAPFALIVPLLLPLLLGVLLRRFQGPRLLRCAPLLLLLAPLPLCFGSACLFRIPPMFRVVLPSVCLCLVLLLPMVFRSHPSPLLLTMLLIRVSLIPRLRSLRFQSLRQSLAWCAQKSDACTARVFS